MSEFSPITEVELARARHDPAFRQKLLAENLDVLLVGLQKARNKAATAGVGAVAEQIREGVALAVRLAELIQNDPAPPR